MLSLDVKPTMCHQRKYGAAFQLDGTPAFRKTSTASSSSEKRDNAGTQKMPARGMTTVARMRPPAIAVSISIDTRSWSECTRTAPSTLRCGRSACHGDAQLGDTGSPGKCSSDEPHCKAQKPRHTMVVVRITDSGVIVKRSLTCTRPEQLHPRILGIWPNFYVWMRLMPARASACCRT